MATAKDTTSPVPSTEEKVCTKCGLLQPVTQFRFAGDKTHPLRRRGDCHTCNALVSKQYWVGFSARAKELKRLDRLNHPEKARTYRSEHQEERRAKDRERWRRHKDKLKAYYRAYFKKYPEKKRAQKAKRRAQKAHSPVNDLTAAQWVEIKAAYQNTCVYCGKKQQRLTMDHIIPLVKGGAHTASNIVPACKSCNSKKQAGPPLVPVQPLLLTIAVGKKTMQALRS